MFSGNIPERGEDNGGGGGGPINNHLRAHLFPQKWMEPEQKGVRLSRQCCVQDVLYCLLHILTVTYKP